MLVTPVVRPLENLFEKILAKASFRGFKLGMNNVCTARLSEQLNRDQHPTIILYFVKFHQKKSITTAFCLYLDLVKEIT